MPIAHLFEGEQALLIPLQLDLFLLDLGLEVGLVGGHVLDVVLHLLDVLLHRPDRQLQASLNFLYMINDWRP